MPGFANCDVHHQLLCRKFNCFCRRRHTNVKTPRKTFLPICCWKNQRTADNIVNVSGLLKSRSYLDDSSHKLEPHTTQRTETANTAGCLFKTDMMLLQPACPTRRPYASPSAHSKLRIRAIMRLSAALLSSPGSSPAISMGLSRETAWLWHTP